MLRIMVFHPKSKRKPLKIQQYLDKRKKVEARSCLMASILTVFDAQWLRHEEHTEKTYQ